MTTEQAAQLIGQQKAICTYLSGIILMLGIIIGILLTRRK